jgi:putative oxidoreductase
MNTHSLSFPRTHRAGSARALSDTLAAQVHWLPRTAFAAVFLFHGLGKFADMAGFASMMGLPFAVAVLVALAEVAGGLGVLAGALLRRGWLTRLGGLATVPVMIGAIAMVHWGQWSFVASDSHPMGGMEFQVLLLALGLWYALTGNGQERARH